MGEKPKWKSYRELRVYILASQRRSRNKVIDRLGGKCNWPGCEWTDRRALQIDHKHGNGNKERKIMDAHMLRRRILTMEHPETEYQLLCANHNAIKKIENREYGEGKVAWDDLTTLECDSINGERDEETPAAISPAEIVSPSPTTPSPHP